MKTNKKCFVMMPFREELFVFYEQVIRPTLEDAGFDVFTASSIASPGNIISDILKSIYESDLIIADLTGKNPNVFYELGVAHTLGKYVILLTQAYEDVPFDLKVYRMIIYRYSVDGVRKAANDLTRALQAIDFSTPASSPVLDVVTEVPSVEEVRIIREELNDTKQQIKENEKKQIELEAQLRSLHAPNYDAKKIIEMLIQDEGIRTLQIELAEKEKQIAELLTKPAVTNEQIALLEKENRKLLDQFQLMRSRLQVIPHWGIPPKNTDDKYVFVLMPFREEWSDIVWEIIKNTITDMGLKCERADDKTGRFIMHDIWSGINTARIVIADLTEGNPNVTYEVGMCDVLGKSQILLAQNPKDIPFDFLGIRLLPYSYVTGGIKKLKSDLRERVENILRD